MLWLIVIVLVVGMLFVMSHKPAINSAGAQWVPPEQRLPSRQIEVVTPPADAQAPAVNAMPDTFDFNDLYGRKPSAPSDRPQA